MHDFDAIVLMQDMACVLAARDDPAIDFHRHPAIAETHREQECRDRRARLEAAWRSIEEDVHGAIVACGVADAATQLEGVTVS